MSRHLDMLDVDAAIMAVHQRGRDRADDILIGEVNRLRMAVKNLLGIRPSTKLEDDVVGLCAVGRIDDAKRLLAFSENAS